MTKFLLWLILLVFCWPLALLALVLYPLVWLLLLPFRVLGIAVDGVLPLGPDFISKAIDMLNKSKTVKELKDNDRFQRMRGMIPGDAVTEQVGFIQKSMEAMTGWVTKFVADNKWDPNAVSKQCGAAVMLKALVEGGFISQPA